MFFFSLDHFCLRFPILLVFSKSNLLLLPIPSVINIFISWISAIITFPSLSLDWFYCSFSNFLTGHLDYKPIFYSMWTKLLLLLYLARFVCMLGHFNCVQVFAILWTVAWQAPLSMWFTRQEYWSGLPCPSPPTRFTMQHFHYYSILKFKIPIMFSSCIHEIIYSIF